LLTTLHLALAQGIYYISRPRLQYSDKRNTDHMFDYCNMKPYYCAMCTVLCLGCPKSTEIGNKLPCHNFRHPAHKPAIGKKTARPISRKSRKSYDAQRMLSALGDVEAGMSVKKAALTWSVPRTTLNNLKLGRYKPDARPGPCTILTQAEELLLQEWIVEMSRRGLPMNRENLLDSIQVILSEDGRANPFLDNRPGNSWFKLFLKRHPLVSQRHSEAISRGRGLLTEGCVRGWFKDAKEYFRSKNIEYVLNDPSKQYNGDETGFQIDPKTGKILGPKGEVLYCEAGGNKEQMSVLVTTRADGKLMTSAIVYPYKKYVPKIIVDSLPRGFCIAKSESGWMTSSIFFEYFANTFIPELAAIRRVEKGLAPDEELLLDDSDWIVFWIDGYSSHLTMHTSRICELNKIVLYCFKAHSSHICQPNDVGPFKPLKNEWRKAVSDWRLSHPYTTLNKISFAEVLAITIQKLDCESVKSGYRSTGLYPFDENAVHYERLTASNQRRYDDRAFGQSSNELASNNEVALGVIESILGDSVIAQYREVQNLCLVDLSLLPNVNSYIICRHLNNLIGGETTQQQLQLTSLEGEISLQMQLQEVVNDHQPMLAGETAERFDPVQLQLDEQGRP
jgi:DDE superfamily endonuclease/Tc5 transposase DNA-binding domain